MEYRSNPDLKTVLKDFKGTPYKNGMFLNLDLTSNKHPLHKLVGWILSRITPWRAIRRRREKFSLRTVTPSFVDNSITWLGHLSFLIRIDGKTIITDPVLDSVPLTSRHAQPPITADQLPPIDYVLLTHAHSDHLCRKTLRMLPGKPKILTGLGMSRYLRGSSAEEAGWFQQYSTEKLFIIFLPSQHSNRRSSTDTNRALWGSFSIEGANTSIFFCGDTGFGDHFRTIKKVCKPGYCVMPIGAYAPRSYEKKEHTTPEEAMQAFDILEGQVFIPSHYGTFELSSEPLAEPIERLQKLDRQEVLIPALGESVRMKKSRRKEGSQQAKLAELRIRDPKKIKA